jgi:hypothetical protein
MKVSKILIVAMLFAMPAFAAEGTAEGAKTAGRSAAMEMCKADPEKCKAAMQARHEACKADPEKCRKERMAQREQWCVQNPEKCGEMKAKMEQRREACKADPEKCRKEHQARADAHFKKTDADGNGSLSREEADRHMPRLARHFDALDTNKDGQLSREELSAARKAHRGAKASKS